MATLVSTATSVSASTFTPAMTPPPGVQSNPDNPESLAYLSNVTVGICVPFVTVFFFSRCFVRIWIKRKWILEDWLAFAAWAGTIAYCAIMITTMRNHGGEHIWDLTAAEAEQIAYWFNIASIEYGVMICITKLAVLWLYRRVFSPRRWSPFDITIVGLIVILIGFYASTTFVKIFECTPRAKIFNQKLPGTCVNVSTLLSTSGLFNTITDFIILFLPVHAVTRLKMSNQKKLLVIFVFTFGLCAPVFSTIGFVVRLRISGNPDTTWNQPEILLWGAAELTTGNLCVCFPEMGALFNRKAREQRQRIGPTASILQGSTTNGRSRRFRSAHDGHMQSSLVEAAADSGFDRAYIALADRKSCTAEIVSVHTCSGSED